MSCRLASAGTLIPVGGILLAWDVGQFPYLVPPDLTIANSASAPSVTGPLLISTLVGMAFLLPSLWLLFWIFKAHGRPEPHRSAQMHLDLLPAPPELDLNQERPASAGEMRAMEEKSLVLAAAASFAALVAGLIAMLALGLAVTFRRMTRTLRRHLVDQSDCLRLWSEARWHRPEARVIAVPDWRSQKVVEIPEAPLIWHGMCAPIT